MDFRYTTTGEPPPSPQYRRQPQPQPPPQSGFGKLGFGLGNDYFSQGIDNTNDNFGQGIGRSNKSLRVLNHAHQEIQRDLEKERIRDEIIAAEIAWKRVLEAEVRAELWMEREMALRLRGSNAFDKFSYPMEAGMALEPRGISFPQEARGLSLEEKIAIYVEERLRMGARWTQGLDMVPFQWRSVESKVKEATPSRSKSGKQKEKIVFLAKPSADLSGTKRKVVSPAKESANELFGGGNKKGKKEWSCVICQISTTSERGLNDHFKGKKHKSKEAALKGEVNDCNIGFGVLPKKTTKPIIEVTCVSSPPQGLKSGGEPLPINQSEPLSFNIVSTKCLDEKSESMLPKNEKKDKLKKKKLFGVQKAPKSKPKEKKNYTFWCAMCQVGAHTEKVMEGHTMGKKHLKLLQKTSKTGEVNSTTQIVGSHGANGASDEATEEGDSEAFDNINRTTNEEHVENKDENANEEKGGDYEAAKGVC